MATRLALLDVRVMDIRFGCHFCIYLFWVRLEFASLGFILAIFSSFRYNHVLYHTFDSIYLTYRAPFTGLLSFHEPFER